MHKHEKEVENVGPIDLVKAYASVNREAQSYALKMHNMDNKLLNGIREIYVNNLFSVRLKVGRGRKESESFRIINCIR